MYSEFLKIFKEWSVKNSYKNNFEGRVIFPFSQKIN